MKKLAILDIGTNTFHLLIYEIENNQSLYQVFKEKIFVKLAAEGIEKISEEAFQRALETLAYYRKILDEHQVDDLFAFGTAAMRKASNAEEFINAAKEKYAIPIHIISGAKEAELITIGVRKAVEFKKEPYLIMDIGGGSIELIIADKENILFSKSYPAGAAILRKKYHQHEPISDHEVREIKKFLKTTFKEFLEIVKKYEIKKIAGASGSFDTIGEILFYPDTQDDFFRNTNEVEITIEQFKKVYQDLLKKDLEDRINTKGLIEQRADLIVVACIAIDLMIEALHPEGIILSNFAMKEGILQEYLADNLKTD